MARTSWRVSGIFLSILRVTSAPEDQTYQNKTKETLQTQISQDWLWLYDCMIDYDRLWLIMIDPPKKGQRKTIKCDQARCVCLDDVVYLPMMNVVMCWSHQGMPWLARRSWHLPRYGSGFNPQRFDRFDGWINDDSWWTDDSWIVSEWFSPWFTMDWHLMGKETNQVVLPVFCSKDNINRWKLELIPCQIPNRQSVDQFDRSHSASQWWCCPVVGDIWRCFIRFDESLIQ